MQRPRKPINRCWLTEGPDPYFIHLIWNTYLVCKSFLQSSFLKNFPSMILPKLEKQTWNCCICKPFILILIADSKRTFRPILMDQVINNLSKTQWVQKFVKCRYLSWQENKLTLYYEHNYWRWQLAYKTQKSNLII